MKKIIFNKDSLIKKKTYNKFKLNLKNNFSKKKSFLLKELSIILNNYHGKKYSIKQWQFIIGYWLEDFLRIYLYY